MLIAIEGTDSVGKATQCSLLKKRFEENNISNRFFSFPNYKDNIFGKSIKEYLNGDYGEVHPKLAALLYANDRFMMMVDLWDWVDKNSIVVCDRYVSSNLAYQGAKLWPNHKKIDELLGWIAYVEHNFYGLPKADLTILLDMPVNISNKLISGRKTIDKYEKDLIYLDNCRSVYHHLAELNFNSKWAVIKCVDNQNNLLSPEIINSKIYEEITNFYYDHNLST